MRTETQNQSILKMKVRVLEIMMMKTGMELVNMSKIPIQNLMMKGIHQSLYNQLQVRTFDMKPVVLDANDALGGAYVPPHLRNAQSRDDCNSEAILKLTRQLKGLLNR